MDRITRPTVRLAGGLPDGNLSSLETLAGRLLSGDPPDVYALVLLSRARLIEDDDQDGAETAVVKVRALEVFVDGKIMADITEADDAAGLLLAMRADRVGVDVLPLATSAEAAADDAARAALREWADTNLDEGRDGLAAEWDAYFGERSPAGTVTSWRDAPRQMIEEFLAYKGEPQSFGSTVDTDDPGPDDMPEDIPADVTHEHGQHTAHTHDADDYADHQQPIDNERVIPAAQFAEPTA